MIEAAAGAVVGVLVTKGLEGAALWLRGFGSRKLGAVKTDRTYATIGYDRVVWTTTADGSATVARPGLFLRLRILNARKEPANDVCVSVESVGQRQGGTDRYERIREDKCPFALVWSSTERGLDDPGDTRWDSLVEPQKLVDLLCIPEPRRDAAEMELVTAPKPGDDSHRFGPGAYRFGIAISASNINRVVLTADVTVPSELAEAPAWLSDHRAWGTCMRRSTARFFCGSGVC